MNVELFTVVTRGIGRPDYSESGRRLTAADPQEILAATEIRAMGTTVCDNMADCRSAIVIIVRVVSTLDEDVEIESIGNNEDDLATYTTIGVNDICPAGDRIDIIMYGDYWRPYVGIRVIAAVAPTAGSISAEVINQE